MPSNNYNVFIPGQRAAQINIAQTVKKQSGQSLTTERAVGGTMYYGVFAANAAQALQFVQAMVGPDLTEASSVFLQSNDTRI